MKPHVTLCKWSKIKIFDQKLFFKQKLNLVKHFLYGNNKMPCITDHQPFLNVLLQEIEQIHMFTMAKIDLKIVINPFTTGRLCLKLQSSVLKILCGNLKTISHQFASEPSIKSQKILNNYLQLEQMSVRCMFAK